MSEITTPEGKPWDFRLWMIWAYQHGFVLTYPFPPTFGAIFRPVPKEMIDRYDEIPVGDLLYVYDLDGDAIWFDFLWAPRQYNIVYEFLEATGKKWVGWQHKTTQKPHLRKVSAMAHT